MPAKRTSPRPSGRLWVNSNSLSSLVRAYWDRDAATYDDWFEHRTFTAVERAAWAGVLARTLTPGTRVLDVGAGTGFLSLVAARLGCEVTALDISATMIERLRDSAARERLAIETICGPADQPPPGPFDVVMERLMLWTLPEPDSALSAWRDAAPGGSLLVFEAQWTRDYAEGARRRARKLLHKLRRLPPEHHAPYPSDVLAALPISQEEWPGALIERIEASGWGAVQMTRLRDAEWARLAALPPLDRLLGVTPEYLITARA